ncbi:MAG: 50S ribosomal protein L30 [Deltaproteobacteria bacterium]|nr:50S ribosomal protein L30 [Deltaproteobacteria bacterium]
MTTSTKIVVKQVRSIICCSERQRLTLKGLGLKRIGHTVELPDTPAIRGMIIKVQHLLDVAVKDGAPKLTGARHRNKKS